jgi:hypothetical protein
MDPTTKYNLKLRAIDETRHFILFVGYVWLALSLFEIHKLAVLRTQHIGSRLGFKLGLDLVNALVLGKIVLIGDSLHLGEQLKDRALIYEVLFRSAVFAVLLICFEISEEVVIGMLHGKTMTQSIPPLGGGGVEGIVLVSIMLFACLIPLFAILGIRRALGDAEFHSLLFDNNSKRQAARPAAR